MNPRIKNLTCCFTGHRDIPEGEIPKIISRIDNRLYPLLEFGVCYFGIGGAIGFDMLMAKHLLELRQRDFKRIKIIEVLPYPGYRKRWSEADTRAMECIDAQVDKLTYIAKEPDRGAYLRRDRRLVDCSEYCFCYCVRATGGTAFTAKYALQNGLKVYNASSFDIHTLLENELAP